MGACHRRSAGGGMEGEMISTTWTEERTALLTRLWQEGGSAAVVAAEMGLTKNMVIGKIHRLGLPARGGPKTTIARRRKAPRPATIPEPLNGGGVPDAAKVSDVAPEPLIARGAPYLDRTTAQCAWILTADIRGMPMEAVRVCGSPVERREDGAPRSYCLKHRLIGTAMRGMV